MAIRPFLAMTAAEIRKNPPLSAPIAWMACHFSPYGTCASNLPRELPPGSLLILDDITPIHGHDPEEIAAQLVGCVQQLECRGVLLDFQRPGCEEAAALAAFLADALPYSVAVSEPYAHGLRCPVFLPPVPPDVPVKDFLQPWQDREVWLEISPGGKALTLTPEGTVSEVLSETPKEGHADEALHCHYQIRLEEDHARFTLFRTQEDLENLLEEAGGLGVSTAVGLYQEFSNAELLFLKPPLPR